MTLLFDEQFEQSVNMKFQDLPADVESAWDLIKTGLLEAVGDTCGWTRGGCQRHKEIWWWNEVVDHAVKGKRKAWKLWKNAG